MLKYLYENEQNRTPVGLTDTIERLKADMRIVRERNLRTLANFTDYRRRIEMEGRNILEGSKRAMMDPVGEIIGGIEKALVWVGNEPHPVV
jgi:hypothetical protein